VNILKLVIHGDLFLVITQHADCVYCCIYYACRDIGWGQGDQRDRTIQLRVVTCHVHQQLQSACVLLHLLLHVQCLVPFPRAFGQSKKLDLDGLYRVAPACKCKEGLGGAGCEAGVPSLPLNSPTNLVSVYNLDMKLVWNTSLNTAWSLYRLQVCVCLRGRGLETCDRVNGYNCSSNNIQLHCYVPCAWA
jgi:hypothetical protein